MNESVLTLSKLESVMRDALPQEGPLRRMGLFDPLSIRGTMTGRFPDKMFMDRHLPECEQFRFPRSKKRRIRKKWAARPENWRAKINFYMTEGSIITGPRGYTQIKLLVDA